MMEEFPTSEQFGRSVSLAMKQQNVPEHGANDDDDENDNDNDEIALQWATLEKLPTYKRVKLSLIDNACGSSANTESNGKTIVDVTKLGEMERQFIVEKLIKHVEVDNRRLLLKMKERMDRVALKLPSVEVKFKDLYVEAECEVVHGKPLPTLWNTMKSIFSAFANIYCCKTPKAKLSIIKGVSGIVKPSRMTLLLGSPGCGKSTLLKALAGKLDYPLKDKGEIYYNGCRLKNHMPQKISAYISQYDLHVPDLTVKETIDFSARCQGVERKEEIMMEVSRREKQAGIIPDPDIDTYMKATSVNGLESSLQTDYILKILGLDTCANTIVGDSLRRGISGGQKRRLATGEIIVGPRRAFFMDEISNGLDSSTTFQIVSCLQQLVHIMDITALISLLQAAPETFELFDDIILFAEGKIVYHGPRNDALKFFEECGFRCPERKGVADFLQEVVSKRNQHKYWGRNDAPYRYISVDEFHQKFRESITGKQLYEELSKAAENAQSQQNFQCNSSNSKYSTTNWELFKACFAREVLLMRRNLSVHVVREAQLIIIALISMTMFLRTRMNVDLKHANYYLGSLFYGVFRIAANGMAELSMTVSRLPIFCKHREFDFYPAWVYSTPAFLLSVPLSVVESLLWTGLTYYVIGYSPEIVRFFRQFLLFFALHQASTSLFRFIATICRTFVLAAFSSMFYFLIMMLFSGFIIPQSSLPEWLRWGFWIFPFSYAQIGVSLNEFLAPRWNKVFPNNLVIAREVLSSHGLNFQSYFYWISLGAIFGFTMLNNIGFTLALTYMKPPGRGPVVISYENFQQLKKEDNHQRRTRDDIIKIPKATLYTPEDEKNIASMKLNFQPLTLTFQHIQYYVDTPQEIKRQGFAEKRLQLLHDVTGAFRPGILTAMMGVSGAGKTTLMDVLSGRKTSGYIEGSIKIGGFPKVQKTFARISGYCEQNDIHSPYVTIEETVTFSAWLRLSAEIDANTKLEFVKDVLKEIELNEMKDALVGTPGISGLSKEQRKRLTIAVELVSNPSIIFMDEPTTGLDARAAAIVMRTVKNVAESGRTVVCTIHQPSIDIFEAFDEVFLMKKGGQVIYSGPLGEHSSKLIEYFEGIPGVPKIKENYNPATWMLEVTTSSVEEQLGLDFAQVYKESSLYRENLELVEELSVPPDGSKQLNFPTLYSQSVWEQFKLCLWKQNLSYWRSPEYNLIRLALVTFASVLLAAVMWQKAKSIHNEQDLFNILSSIYIVLQLVGTFYCSAIIPVLAAERLVLYQERFAGMYSAWSFSLAQVTIEIPYLFVQAFVFVAIVYPAMGFYWSTFKLLWFFYAIFNKFLYYCYLGMFLVSLSPNTAIASLLALLCYTFWNLLSGFLIPEPDIPKWWIWCYWTSPPSWSIKGIITSQYGDISQQIMVFGEKKALNSFLEDYYGFHHDKLGLAAAVLACFPLLFASLFALLIKYVNFQK